MTKIPVKSEYFANYHLVLMGTLITENITIQSPVIFDGSGPL